MKKILSLLMAIAVVVSFTGCGKKQIAVSAKWEEGNMKAELAEGTVFKDLLDAMEKGTGMTYELDDEGKIVSINGKANDETGNWTVSVNGTVSDSINAQTVLNDGDDYVIEFVSNTAETLVGGWQIAEVARMEMDQKEEDIFNKAMEGLLGVGYEPVCVLATQVVSGTNYAYLARGTTVTATPVSNFYIIKIYEDLQGNVEQTSINQIDVTDIKTREDTDSEIVGGWTVTDTGKPGTLGSQEAQASFDKAVEGLVGVGYNPIQLLATQLVSGTNYIALARGKVVGVEDKPELYVISWYEDLSGNCEIKNIAKFDLNQYVE